MPSGTTSYGNSMKGVTNSIIRDSALLADMTPNDSFAETRFSSKGAKPLDRERTDRTGLLMLSTFNRQEIKALLLLSTRAPHTGA